ncbi:MAG: hypothetical protein IT267_05805 [Saprospiraceae bacterium]|nr:hypothetical protein [Saprospiraceae bacterium]
MNRAQKPFINKYIKMLRYSWLLFFVLTIDVCFAQSSDEEEFKKNYEKRILLARINDVYIPINTEDAIKELIRLTEKDARDKLITVPEDTIASKLHFSLGRWIMINWGLEQGSRLSHYYFKKGVGEKDDMIDLLLRCFYRRLAGKELHEEMLVDHYKQLQKERLEERRKKSILLKTIKPGANHRE